MSETNESKQPEIEVKGSNPQGENKTEEKQEPKADESLTLTPEELQKRLDAESDRRVTKALETAKQKWEVEWTEKLEKERTEAEKLAKMGETERLRHEFEQERKAIDEERKDFMREKLELETVKMLQAETLPTEFSEWVHDDSAEKINDNIKRFKEQWQSAIQKEVDNRLKGQTPKSSNSKQSITSEDFSKMGYRERAALSNSNPDLYARLTGRQ